MRRWRCLASSASMSFKLIGGINCFRLLTEWMSLTIQVPSFKLTPGSRMADRRLDHCSPIHRRCAKTARSLLSVVAARLARDQLFYIDAS
jgi:hypothetical protein